MGEVPLYQVPKPIASIEEGMNNFIKAETLDGNNRYQLDPDEKSGRTEKMMVAPHAKNRRICTADFTSPSKFDENVPRSRDVHFRIVC